MKDPRKRMRYQHSVSNYQEWLDILDQVEKAGTKKLLGVVPFLIVLVSSLALLWWAGAFIVNYLP